MILRVLSVLAALMALAAPAEAHKLKLFATVANDRVSGYAFFIGGGRAEGVDWAATSGSGGPIASGKTDDQGNYAFAVPGPEVAPVTVSVDTHEGHMASVTLGAERFGGAPGPAAAPEADPTGTDQDARMAALVEAAVARQVTPLAEQIEALQDRLRYADILSALFMIAGLAGAGLWLSGRRKGEK
ncbi:cobalamin biosynthesis protein CbiL [Paenirhodobacter enshiensis]|uniref:cobalamin biosynthesis protein CbiL n=1 Tax=Paenirhodobacter enshiensis TaxID=1105367 RepID=UPI0035B14E26